MGGPGGSMGGGGFNPVEMIRRFDRNGNGMLDPDETEGPARFFLERMAQNNPRIDLSKPIPIDRLAEEMDRMRQERGGGGGFPGGPTTPQAPKEPEPLVPGFGKVEPRGSVEGFGAVGAAPTVLVEERDLREAEDRIKRYDKNNDGFLSKEELDAGRWSDNPMQYDRNRDGKLSQAELAVRYAERRLAQAGQQPQNATASRGSFQRSSGEASAWGSRGGDAGGGGGWGSRGGDAGGGGGWGSRDGGGDSRSGRGGQRSAEADAKSYRHVANEVRASDRRGLPDWFVRNDADGDGQVLMSEFSSTWNESKLADFQAFDLNGDGIITDREALLAVRNGARLGSSLSSSSGSTSAGGSSAGAATTSSASSRNASGTGGASGSSLADDEAKNLAWVKRTFERADKNQDGRLTVDEWSEMTLRPEGADTDGDGAISLEEYAAFRKKGGK
jgi:Ca2+-binding EF-hand superfamily protein